MSRVVSRLTKDAVTAEVCALRGVSRKEVDSTYVERRIAHVRQEIWWRLRQMTDSDGKPRFSYPAIGRAFGRDHTTIIFGCRQHEKRIHDLGKTCGQLNDPLPRVGKTPRIAA